MKAAPPCDALEHRSLRGSTLLAALDEKKHVSISPLRKRRVNGALYTRIHNVEAKLIELVALPREKLVE